MTLRSKPLLQLSLLGAMMIQMSPALAGMVGTSEILQPSDQVQIVNMLEREDVQLQLIELGVDPASAQARVSQLTNAEVSQINGRLAELPAGAGVGTVELLLIIIILILLL